MCRAFRDEKRASKARNAASPGKKSNKRNKKNGGQTGEQNSNDTKRWCVATTENSGEIENSARGHETRASALV